MPAFADLLYKLVKDRGISLRAFAERIDYPHNVFPQIKAGTRPVPMAQVGKWADALDLPQDSPERERFLDLAALTHVPDDEARARIERVLAKYDDLKIRQEALRRQVDELLHQTPRLPRRPPPTA